MAARRTRAEEVRTRRTTLRRRGARLLTGIGIGTEVAIGDGRETATQTVCGTRVRRGDVVGVGRGGELADYASLAEVDKVSGECLVGRVYLGALSSQTFYS